MKPCVLLLASHLVFYIIYKFRRNIFVSLPPRNYQHGSPSSHSFCCYGRCRLRDRTESRRRKATAVLTWLLMSANPGPFFSLIARTTGASTQSETQTTTIAAGVLATSTARTVIAASTTSLPEATSIPTTRSSATVSPSARVATATTTPTPAARGPPPLISAPRRSPSPPATTPRESPPLLSRSCPTPLAPRLTHRLPRLLRRRILPATLPLPRVVTATGRLKLGSLQVRPTRTMLWDLFLLATPWSNWVVQWLLLLCSLSELSCSSLFGSGKLRNTDLR